MKMVLKRKKRMDIRVIFQHGDPLSHMANVKETRTNKISNVTEYPNANGMTVLEYMRFQLKANL